MDFHNMKRIQLQALCKTHRIPANLTNREMANRLTSIFKEKEKPISPGGSSVKIPVEIASENDSKVMIRNVKKVRFSPENETFIFMNSETESDKEYTPAMKRRGRRKSMAKPVSKKQTVGLPAKIGVTPVRTRTRALTEIEGDVNIGLSPPVVKKRSRRGTKIESIEVKSVDVSDKPLPVVELGDDVEVGNCDGKVSDGLGRRQLRNRKVVVEKSGEDGVGDLGVSRKNMTRKGSKKRVNATGSDGLVLLDESSEEHITFGVIAKPERITKRSKQIVTMGKDSAAASEELGKTVNVGRNTRSRTQLKGKASAVESEAISVEVEEESEKLLQLKEPSMALARNALRRKSAVPQKGRVDNKILDWKCAEPRMVLRKSKRNVAEGKESEMTRSRTATLNSTVPADGELGIDGIVGRAERLTEPCPGKDTSVTEKSPRQSRRNASRQNSMASSNDLDEIAVVVEKGGKLKRRRETILNEETYVVEFESLIEKPMRKSTRVASKRDLVAPAGLTVKAIEKKQHGTSKTPVIIEETSSTESILAPEEQQIEDAALAVPEAAGNNNNPDSNFGKEVFESSKVKRKKTRGKSGAKKQLSSVKVSIVCSDREKVINITENLVERPVPSPVKLHGVSTSQETLNFATASVVVNEKDSNLLGDEKEKSLMYNGVEGHIEEQSGWYLNRRDAIDDCNLIDSEQVGFYNKVNDVVSSEITSPADGFSPPNQSYHAGEPSNLSELEKGLETEEPSTSKGINPGSDNLDGHSSENDKTSVLEDQNFLQSEDAHQIVEQVIQEVVIEVHLDGLGKSTRPERNPENSPVKAEELSALDPSDGEGAAQAENLVEAIEMQIVSSESHLETVESDAERIAELQFSLSGHCAPVATPLKTSPESQEWNQPEAQQIAQSTMLGTICTNHVGECFSPETEILDETTSRAETSVSNTGVGMHVLEKIEDDKTEEYEHEEAWCFERASAAVVDEIIYERLEVYDLSGFNKTDNPVVEEEENLVSQGNCESNSEETGEKCMHELSVGEGILPATPEDKASDTVDKGMFSFERILLKYNDEYEQVSGIGNKNLSCCKINLPMDNNIKEQEETQLKDQVSSSVKCSNLAERSDSLLNESTNSIGSDAVDAADEKVKANNSNYEDVKDVVKGDIQPEFLLQFSLEKLQDGVEGGTDKTPCQRNYRDCSAEKRGVSVSSDSSGNKAFSLEKSASLTNDLAAGKRMKGESDVELCDYVIKEDDYSVCEEVPVQVIGGADTSLTEAIGKASGISEERVEMAIIAAESIERINMLRINMLKEEENKTENKNFDANEAKFCDLDNLKEETVSKQDESATIASDNMMCVDGIAADRKAHDGKVDSDLNLNDYRSDAEKEDKVDAIPQVTLNEIGSGDKCEFQVHSEAISNEAEGNGISHEDGGNDTIDTDFPFQAVDEVKREGALREYEGLIDAKNGFREESIARTSEEVAKEQLDHDGAVKDAGSHKLDDMVVTGDDSREFLDFENFLILSSSKPEMGIEGSALSPVVAYSNHENNASEFHVESPMFTTWEMNLILGGERDEVDISDGGDLEFNLLSQKCEDAMEVKETTIEQEDKLVVEKQPEEQEHHAHLAVSDELICDGCEVTNEKEDVSDISKEYIDHEDEFVEAHVTTHKVMLTDIVMVNGRSHAASDKPLAECEQEEYIANPGFQDIFRNSTHPRLLTGSKWEEKKSEEIKLFADSSCNKPEIGSSSAAVSWLKVADSSCDKPEIGSSSAAVSWLKVPAFYEEEYNPHTYRMEVCNDATAKETSGEDKDINSLFQEYEKVTIGKSVGLKKDDEGLCDSTDGFSVENNVIYSQEAAKEQLDGCKDAFDEAIVMDGTDFLALNHPTCGDKSKSHVAEVEAAHGLHMLDGKVVTAGDTVEVANIAVASSLKSEMVVDCSVGNDSTDMDPLFQEDDKVTIGKRVGALKDDEGLDDATDGFSEENKDIDSQEAVKEQLDGHKDVAHEAIVMDVMDDMESEMVDCSVGNDSTDMNPLFEEDDEVTIGKRFEALKDDEGLDDATDGFSVENKVIDSQEATKEQLDGHKDVAHEAIVMDSISFLPLNQPVYGGESKSCVVETEEVYCLHKLDDKVVTAGDTIEVADFENLDSASSLKPEMVADCSAVSPVSASSYHENEGLDNHVESHIFTTLEMNLFLRDGEQDEALNSDAGAPQTTMTNVDAGETKDNVMIVEQVSEEQLCDHEQPMAEEFAELKCTHLTVPDETNKEAGEGSTEQDDMSAISEGSTDCKNHEDEPVKVEGSQVSSNDMISIEVAEINGNNPFASDKSKGESDSNDLEVDIIANTGIDGLKFSEERNESENIGEAMELSKDLAKLDSTMADQSPAFVNLAIGRDFSAEDVQERPDAKKEESSSLFATQLSSSILKRKTNKTNLIQRTPNRFLAHDMKENAQSTKSEQIGNITAPRTLSKRRALEDLHKN